METDTRREKSLSDYRKKLLEHRELDARLKESKSVISAFGFVIFLGFKRYEPLSSGYFTLSLIMIDNILKKIIGSGFCAACVQHCGPVGILIFSNIYC